MIHSYLPDAVRTAEAAAVARAEAASGPDVLMARAARAVADTASRVGGDGATCLALVGGGDNGGDALLAAAHLAGEGHEVRAAVLSPHPHARALAVARSKGVEVVDVVLPLEGGVPGWMAADLWIDGITGSGLTGALREPLAGAVAALDRAAHAWGTLVVAVDVPTGAGAADGTLAGPVLAASTTVTMGAAKSMLFLPPAALAAGDVVVADLGFTPDGDPVVDRPCSEDVAEALVEPGPTDQKYTRGVVTVAAGSDTYPGAGVLATAGALGVGPGMVRLESGGRTARIVLDRHPGVVTASGRAQAAVVGSGLDAEVEPIARAVAGRALARGIPLVIDAGGLGFVAGLVRDHGRLTNVVLTPHAGEAATLLSELDNRAVRREEVESAPLEAATRLCDLSGATVLLKGAVTLVVGPGRRVMSVAGAPAWTGVAGSGDVLAGVTGSLLAQRRARAEAGEGEVDLAATAAHAAWLHARAAAMAVEANEAGVPGGSGVGAPIQPDDIAAALPRVLASLFAVRHDARARARRSRWDAGVRGSGR